jgi:hypothetical protein
VTRALGAGLFLFALVLAGCRRGPTGGGECPAFGAYTSDVLARADAAVPEPERQAARSAAEIAAWQRKLAKAYDVEAAAPARFANAKVKDWEAHYKRTLGLTASSLRKIADGLERGDKSVYRTGTVEQAAAGRERQRIVDDWKRHCTD